MTVSLLLGGCADDATTAGSSNADAKATVDDATPDEATAATPEAASDDTDVPTATEEPSAAAATGDPADPTTTFPAEMRLAHGAAAWGVYMVVTEPGSDEGLEEANTVAGAAGYRPLGLGELGCDQNAAEHLGVDADMWGAALYFETSDEAELVFASFSERGFRPVDIAGVITYCLD